MGNVITIVCCSENHGENNLDGEIEDKITVEEKKIIMMILKSKCQSYIEAFLKEHY